MFGSAKQPITFKTSKILPFSQAQFFRVVHDVDEYQEFIPWINQSRVIPESLRGTKEAGSFEGEV